MATLSDIFASERGEAARYERNPSSFERVEAKRITPLELSTLWAIICGEEWDVSLMDQFAPVGQGKGKSASIYEFPPSLAAALADLEGSRIPTISEAWAESEELACDSEEVQPLIEELAALAAKAHDSSLSLYLWMSL